MYYVLRDINMTDLEIDCLLNDTERQKIYSVNYQKAFVQGLEEILVYLGGDKIAKLLVLSFNNDEDELLDSIMSALDGFRNKTQLIDERTFTKLVFEGMEIDVSKRLIYRDNREINITYIEFEILYLLAKCPGRVFSKEQIYDIAWKEPYSGDYNIVISHIRNIREKIEDNPGKPVYIQTVWGVGYRFNQNISSGL